MATTKALLDATLDAFLTSQKEWVSKQGWIIDESIRAEGSFTSTGGTYVAPYDGVLGFYNVFR